MSDESSLSNSALSATQTSVTEWEKLLTHFEWNEGFSFIVILIPDADQAEIRRQTLERHLAASGKKLHTIRFKNTSELKLLAVTLFDLNLPDDTGAIWVTAVIPEALKNYEEWAAAWREGAARLNQFRNPLRRKFAVPLIFVGAPWLQIALREAAQDLWSIRTTVINIEADAAPLRDFQAANARNNPMPQSLSESAPNVQLALNAIEKLRGKAGNKAELVSYLIRAGRGLIYEAHNYPQAEEILIEAKTISSYKSSIKPKSIWQMLLPYRFKIAFPDTGLDI